MITRLSCLWVERGLAPRAIYTRLMAMEYDVQRLQMNDVVLIDLPEQGGVVEAKVMRDIDRTDTTVRVVLRVVGHEEDFLKEWPIGERVTVVRGP